MGFDAHNTARGARFLLRSSMYLILTQMDQIYLILATAVCENSVCTRYDRVVFRENAKISYT